MLTRRRDGGQLGAAGILQEALGVPRSGSKSAIVPICRWSHSRACIPGIGRNQRGFGRIAVEQFRHVVQNASDIRIPSSPEPSTITSAPADPQTAQGYY